jgi:hypothetical protein
MPTSSAMITTMLGFLAVVCADAAPLNASGIESAVVTRNFLNINVSFVVFQIRMYRSTCEALLRKNRANVQCNTPAIEMLDRSAL